MSRSTEVQTKQENPLYNLIFNIVAPVLILNQLSKRLGDNGPIIALLLALLLPVGYGAYDYLKRKKHNYVSIIGFINVIFTGGFALLRLEGFWFALKDALFPLIIGITIYAFNYFNKPLIKTLFWNDNIFRTDLVETQIREKNNEKLLAPIFRKSTSFLTLSFILSAVLNFILANKIFVEIDKSLPDLKRSEILNQQIAKMTWLGHLIIAVPMMAITGLIMWYVLHQLKKISGMNINDMMAETLQDK